METALEEEANDKESEWVPATNEKESEWIPANEPIEETDPDASNVSEDQGKDQEPTPAGADLLTFQRVWIDCLPKLFAVIRRVWSRRT